MLKNTNTHARAYTNTHSEQHKQIVAPNGKYNIYVSTDNHFQFNML